MLFIVGHKFTVKAPSSNSRNVNSLENSILSRSRQHNFDEFWIMNNTYKIHRIRKMDNKMSYMFINLNTNSVLERFYDSIEQAEEFIANVSGAIQQYKEEKQRIIRTYSSGD